MILQPAPILASPRRGKGQVLPLRGELEGQEQQSILATTKSFSKDQRKLAVKKHIIKATLKCRRTPI